ncbi:MAG TPA: GntR family transcriptional regulator, partial [Desulfobacterales bacterium]|nr:GntR family transcriptional regulator [Desulfobacterales bacterium]
RLKGATTLSNKAYRQIKNMFLTDQLVSGQKLPYQDLAKRLGMSQTPVMMALVRLEDEGLVRSEANKGFSVPPIDLNEARELYEVRILLEVFLIPAVVRNLDAERLAEIEILRKSHREVRGPVYQRERLLRDAHFHLGLAAISGNQVVGLILRRVFDLLYLRYKPEILSPLRQDEAEVEHLGIFEALSARDAAGAAKCLREHLIRGQDRILAGLHAEAAQRQTMMEQPGAGMALENVISPFGRDGERRLSTRPLH